MPIYLLVVGLLRQDIVMNPEVGYVMKLLSVCWIWEMNFITRRMDIQIIQWGLHRGDT